MNNILKNQLCFLGNLLLLFIILVIPCRVDAQSEFQLKDVSPQILAEAGCPVEVVTSRADLEIDGFNIPHAVRVYITYKNSSPKPLSAVNFRVGYVDADGNIVGAFHALDGKVIGPSGESSGKWRGEKVDQKTIGLKVRVVAVKFSDGSQWESSKIKEAPLSNE